MVLLLLCQTFPHSYDVSFYGIYLSIDTDNDTVFGSGEIKASSSFGTLDSVDFHLGQSLTIDSILLNSVNTPFNRVDDTVWVQGPVAGDFELLIFYHGRPSAGLYFDYWGVFSASLSPTGVKDAHQWFPCYDHNGDKADSARFAYTISSDYLVAANGTLDSVVQNGAWKTFYYTEHHPIANYLISVAASYRYVMFSDTWNSTPLVYYAFEPDTGNLAADVQNVPDMLDYFSDVFGYYPFDDEKFGYAECNLFHGGFALEHQTMVTMGSYFITGQRTYELTFAHELSHQWWGDLITCQDWPHVWLNEGFASYCEALYAEHRSGTWERDSVLRVFADTYFAEDAGHRFPIYDPPEAYLWGATVYKKGAWVLHMLRWVMGDSLFFQGLRHYRSLYQGSTATIPDFQSAMEDIYGGSLQWFFWEWIYQAGYPEFEYNWFLVGDSSLNLTVHQVQQNAPVFSMPAEIMIAGAGDTIVDTVWLNELTDRFTWKLGFAPDTVILDPNNWILKKVRFTDTQEPLAGTVFLRLAGNPVKDHLEVFFGMPEAGPVSFKVYDPAGRLLLNRQQVQEGPGPHHQRLGVANLKPGVYILRMVCPWASLSRKFVKQ